MPCGAGISTPECEEDAPDVGDLRFPKYELILVYPGIGQTKPSGLVSITSEYSLLEYESPFELIIGIKNKHTKIKKNIIVKIE